MKLLTLLGGHITRALVAVSLITLAAPIKAATEPEINDAIQDGLAWLATTQNTYDGSFGGGNRLANTATAVLAFENEGYFPGGGSTYSTNVEKGLDFIFRYCHKESVYPQTFGYTGRYDDPDTNGNGVGIFFTWNSRMYETGLVMQAIVASNTPDRVVTNGECAGLKYREVIQDMVDWYAWGQIDAGPGRGGWRYGPFHNYATYADNSISQWPVLGLIAAEQWGIYAPSFVKDELEYWVAYIQHSSGGSGYHTPTTYVNISKTGGLMVEFFYLGDEANTPRAQKATNYINGRWNVGPYSTWYGNRGHPYAMFSVFKGLELMQVPVISNAPANAETPAGDWWGDYAEYIVNTQINPAAGQAYWNGYSYWNTHLATPWYIIILQASVFPISVDIEVPGAACDDSGYDVEVTYSVERFTADGTLSVFKDDMLYQTVILEGFKGSETEVIALTGDSLGTHTWRAELEVTGGGIDAQAVDTDSGEVFETPQVSGIPDQVTPFEPFDLDDFQTCEGDYDIDWSASGVPTGWTVSIDAENVATIVAPEGATDPADITWEAVFHHDGIIDCYGSDTATYTPNRPPEVDPGRDYFAGERYYVDEGDEVPVDGSASYDPDGHALVYYGWDFDGDGVFEMPSTDGTAVFSAAALDNPPTDEVYIYLKVCDEHDACAIGMAEVIILDLPPVAAFTWSPEPQNEGSPVQFTDQSTYVIDPIFTWDWDFDGEGTSFAQNPAFTFADDDVFNTCLTVTDDDGSTDTACNDVTILNVAPLVGPITAPGDPVPIGTEITASAAFTDVGVEDTHTASWDWGDGSSPGTVTQAPGGGSVSDSHTYSVPGVYTLMLTVTDDDSGSGEAVYQYVVIYDPDGSFVTGGGTIDSPLGAYLLNPDLSGLANFGFVSKYKKGAEIPTGHTEFQFHAAGLDFKSTDYQWLVVAGPRAQFKGTGTIKDMEGSFGFFLTAIDGEVSGGGGADKFRIKIWDAADDSVVIYDNQIGGADDADATTVLRSGSIVIHSKGKK